MKMAIKSYVDKNGNVLWTISINLRGKLNRDVKIQRRESGFKSEAEAALALKKLRDKTILEVREKESVGKSWKSLIDAYELAMLESDGLTVRITAGTVQDYIGPIRKYTDDWMDRPVALIRKNEIKKILSQVGKEVSPIRASKLKGFISKAFQWAIETDFDKCITENSTKGIGIENLERRSKRPDILTGEEIRRLLECAYTIQTPWYPIWAMAVMTGMRSGEMYALKWTDIDFENNLISVTKSFSKRAMVKERDRFPDGIKGTKTEEWRNIPISDDLKSFLVDLKKKTGDSGHVLPRLAAWRNSDQAKHLKAFCENIGLNPIVFHALRACFAVQLLQSGVPTVTVMAIGGWEDMETMMKYVRMAGVDVKGATQNLKLLPPREAIAKVIQFPGRR
jgi:integrase